MFRRIAWSLLLLALGASIQAETDKPDPVLIMGYRQALRKDPASAEGAARALARLGPGAEAAIPDLIYALRYDDESPMPAVRDALVAIGPAAVPPLRRALGDGNAFVRRRAAETLGQFGLNAAKAAPELTQLMKDPTYEVRAAAEAALIKIGDPAVDAVSEALRKEPAGDRKLYVDLLPKLGPAAAGPLLQVLKKDGNAFLRASAASGLAELRPVDPDTVPALQRALGDLEESVRGAAADALGQLGEASSPAIGALLVMSQADREPLVRQKAVQALEQIKKVNREALPGLERALRNDSPEVRLAAMAWIGKSEVPFAELQPIILMSLNDPDPRMRYNAVKAASSLSLNGAGALPIFRQALSDQQPEVRSAAIEALGRMKESKPEAAAELSRALQDPNPAIRKQAIQALAQLGPDGLPGLIIALKDPYTVLGDDAAKAIVKIGEPAVPEMKKLQAGFDPVLKKRAKDILRRIANK